jgi:REP element-mobilizing transposase RayT
MALACFITFSTYGTWLHGSAKGSVDSEHNAFGTPLLEADGPRENHVRDAMVQPPYVMSAAERDIVCKAIVELARERGWLLLAVQVRTNHVHVVISADRDPGRLMSELKARASRDLTSAGFDNAERRRWTRHGSTLHLFREEDVEAKTRYTLDEQGERMAWYAQDPQEPRPQ